MYENLTSVSSCALHEVDRHVDVHDHITTARIVKFQIQDVESGRITGLSTVYLLVLCVCVCVREREREREIRKHYVRNS